MDALAFSAQPGVYDKVLIKEACITDSYLYHSQLERHQINALVKLSGIYSENSRFYEAGCLHVMIATRKFKEVPTEPTLAQRLQLLETAQRCFKLCKKGATVEHLRRQLNIQKDVLSIVNSRYEHYSKDDEDVQLLTLLNVSIVPPIELREWVDCWLSDNSEETKAAFEKNGNYKVTDHSHH